MAGPRTASSTVQPYVTLQGTKLAPHAVENDEEPVGKIYVLGQWEVFDPQRWQGDTAYQQRIVNGWNELAPQTVGSGSSEPIGVSTPSFFPVMSPDLAGFLHEVWMARQDILTARQTSEKAAIDLIYKRIYSKDTASGADQGLSGISDVVAGLVKIACEYKGTVHLQQSAIGRGIGKAWAHYKSTRDTDTYRELASRYYYFDVHPGEAKARVIVHANDATVHVTFAKVLAIVAEMPDVTAVKVAGPLLCRTKLDTIVVYLKSSQMAGLLAEHLGGQALDTVDGTPNLTQGTSTGIAFADEPPQVGGRSISFGQKRCIVAYMALRASQGDLKAFYWAAAELVIAAGIDELEPHLEHQQPTHGMQSQIAGYLALLNKKV